MDYDVIIIGSGPAALSASIYLARAKLKTLVVGNPKNSKLTKAFLIENLFGFPQGIQGKELLAKGITQAKKSGAKIIEEEVIDLEKNQKGFQVKLSNSLSLSSKYVIISTGRAIKIGGILNEEKYLDKWVHYHLESNSYIYKNKKIIIIGNSNHAAETALELKRLTNKVSLISNEDKFIFSRNILELLKNENVELIKKKILELNQEKNIKYILLPDKSKIICDAVYIAMGTTSYLDFAQKLNLHLKDNLLIVDKDNKTNIPGVYAIGNASSNCRQIAKNIGDGCNAAINIIKEIKTNQNYIDYGPLNYGVKD